MELEYHDNVLVQITRADALEIAQLWQSIHDAAVDQGLFQIADISLDRTIYMMDVINEADKRAEKDKGL